ncbi:hypothetical protein [Actinoplanes xinjiangensis]|uniref:hypothetical protein n=1 Tax=Actinoplanes xinjiangensis TaxID=512350 RepID=UPI00343F9FC5
MTRPEEPLDDHTLPSPGDPWAAADQPGPTVNLGSPTTYLGGAAASSGDATAPLGDATAYFGQPTAQLGQPTVHLDGASFGRPAARPGDGGGHVGGPPAHLDDPGRTVHLPGPDPVVPATVHGGRSAPPVHPDDSTPTVRAHNELRFGPGVPATPVAAPAWPGAATAERSRPLWRRLVSLISTLLTLALIGVVGFYIWQRLSPLEVEGVTVAVPRPAGNRCDTTVDVVATVRTNGRSGVIRYQWFRSDAPPGAVLTEQVGSGQRTAGLTLKWTFSGVGTATETATINIIEPSPLQVGTQVAYRCRG